MNREIIGRTSSILPSKILKKNITIKIAIAKATNSITYLGTCPYD